MTLLRSSLNITAALLVTGSLLFGCTSTAPKNAALEHARSVFLEARNDPDISKNAPLELQRAQTDLDRAEKILRQDGDRAEVEHLAYLAQQRAAIAREMAYMKLAEQALEAASAVRNKVLLEARTQETQLALREAEKALQEAEQAKGQALAQQKEAEKARMEAEAKAAEAEKARLAAAAAEERARTLEAQIKELQAVKSERGLVITLGDVLFDTNKSDLRSGALFTLEKLVAFLGEYPDRKVMIEGFTDSRGAEEYNQRLSELRALAVRDALVAKGIDSNRIMIRGYGEAFPVASNDTAAGRQHNRRVEVIISDERGVLTERTE